MIKNTLKGTVFIGSMGLFFATSLHAGIPKWTYSAPNPERVTLLEGNTATVQYTVTNQSNKAKNLKLKTTPGLSATPCQLAGKGSTCNVTITIQGDQISEEGIHSGPALCEQGNPNQCYQPSLENQLNVHLITAPQYTNIYAQTSLARVTYSFDNGQTWNRMINQQSSWYLNRWWGSWAPAGTWTASMAFTAKGAMYQAVQSKVQQNSGDIFYSDDGITWNNLPVRFPNDVYDYANVVTVFDDTVYVGTVNGSVVSSRERYEWDLSLNQGNPIDNSGISALIADDSGKLYAGSFQGSVYSSLDKGRTWSQAISSPNIGAAILSLAITNTAGQPNWYVSAANGASYYTTDKGKTWAQMAINWPASNQGDTIIVLAASNNVLYAGTQHGYVYTLTPSGTGTWNAIQQSASIDGSPIRVLTVTQGPLSPLFVEGTLGTSTNPQALPVNGTASLTVKNFSRKTIKNAHIESLPEGVSQTPGANCASVAPNGTCTIDLRARKPFGPYNAAIVGINNNNPIERIALVSSMNGYLVYNVNEYTDTAYVVDNTDASNSVIWSPSSNILNISETDYNPCNSATDGYCNTGVILGENYSGSYAAGVCAAKNSNPAFPGATFTPDWWYLPSACELGAGPIGNNYSFGGCYGVRTGIFSLYGLGYLSDLNNTAYYWQSTEFADDSNDTAWIRYFAPNGGGFPLDEGADKNTTAGVRCTKGFSY